jgi:hypothetical protein
LTDRLATLLAPLQPEAFFESYRKREHLYISRNTAGFYDGVVSLENLDACLQSELIPSTFLNVVNNGVRRPFEDWTRLRSMRGGGLTSSGQLPFMAGIPERLFSLYSEGSTLILNSADQMIPPLRRTCGELTGELRYSVQANIYITPPGTQGFARHRDGHDVLILQISGRKTWLLYPEPANDTEPANDALELEMRPGDFLFVPAGLGHEAKCAEYGSIHVTVRLLPIYGHHLIESLAEAAADNPLFRQPVPREFATEEDKRAFDADFIARLQTLLAETPASTLIEGRFREFVDKQWAGWPGRFSDTLRLQEITGDSVLCARSAIVRRIEDHGSSVEVHFAGTRTTVPLFLRPCLDRILDNTPFAVRDIPGLMTVAGKVEFVRPFVANGLLSVVTI